jgi:TATA-box binding protein (TBP) (component of TFIID and TFIIIB)
VSNVCATVNFGHRIALEALADELRRHGHRTTYEPEHHSWLKVKTPAMTFMMYSSGKANTMGAPSQATIEAEVANMQPMVWQHSSEFEAEATPRRTRSGNVYGIE